MFLSIIRGNRKKRSPLRLSCRIYDDDAVTKGFTAFDVKSCILHFNLTVEDPDGRKIPMKMKFDLADVWKDFIDK